MFNSRTKDSAVGLEIEAGSVAAAEVSVNGTTQLRAHGIEPLPPGAFREGEVTDPAALSAALKQLFSRHSLPKRVRLGVANQRVVVRTMRLPAIDDAQQLEAAIRFQAQDQIPMPLDNAVLDWQVEGLRDGPNGERQLEVVVVAARLDMINSLLSALRDAGLRAVGIDLSAFAMIRALGQGQPDSLAGAGLDAVPAPAYEDRIGQIADAGSEPYDPGTAAAATPTRLLCNLGDVVNLAVAQGSSCLFTRVSAFGVEGIAQRLAERRGLTIDHARQWLIHVGIDRPREEIEGDPEIVAAAAETLADGASKLVDELRLSLHYYGTQEGAQPIESVVACGPGTAIPGLIDRIQRDLGFAVSIGRPVPLVGLDPVTAGRLTLPLGLALEG